MTWTLRRPSATATACRTMPIDGVIPPSIRLAQSSTRAAPASAAALTPAMLSMQISNRGMLDLADGAQALYLSRSNRRASLTLASTERGRMTRRNETLWRPRRGGELRRLHDKFQDRADRGGDGDRGGEDGLL